MDKYDRVIQENIQPLTLSLVKKILGIRDAEITILPRKLQRTLERETDLVILVTLADGQKGIYNREWQTYNDPEMCTRMLLQQSIPYTIYKLPVTGVVIYTGKERMNMATEYRICYLFTSKYKPHYRAYCGDRWSAG